MKHLQFSVKKNTIKTCLCKWFIYFSLILVIELYTLQIWFISLSSHSSKVLCSSTRVVFNLNYILQTLTKTWTSHAYSPCSNILINHHRINISIDATVLRNALTKYSGPKERISTLYTVTASSLKLHLFNHLLLFENFFLRNVSLEICAFK